MKIVEFRENLEKVHGAPERIEAEFARLTGATKTANGEMRVANDRLESAIAKPEHRPQNNLKLAIDDAAVAADHLSGKMNKALRSVVDVPIKNAPGVFANSIGGPRGHRRHREARPKPCTPCVTLTESGIQKASTPAMRGVLASKRSFGMQPDRSFYTATGALFLVLAVLGFRQYIFGGRHVDGSPIDGAMLATVVVHSSAVFAWYVLFFVQSLLISTKNRRIHMTLGWSVLVIAPLIAVTGPLVAIRSTRSSPFGAVVFDWPGPQFLLIMLAEIALFATFVTIGVLARKRPRVHRPMMLLASLAMLSGATGRISWVNSIFGFHTWMALFGPVVSLGALLLLVRVLMTRRLDRELALGYAALALASLVVARVATTNAWLDWAGAILKF